MLRNIAVMSLLVLLSACGSSPKSNFYMLNVESDPVVAAGADKGVSVGVWTVIIPEYLDRSEIVTRDSVYEISVADFDRWANRLDKNMTKLIATELGRRLQSERVMTSPWESYRKMEFQVKIYVDRFDGALGDDAVLQGTWSLLNAKHEKVVATQVFIFKQKTADKTHVELVKALSGLTVQLADQIASTIVAKQHN